MTGLESFNPAEQQALVLMPRAIQRLQNLLSGEETPQPAFRVYVTGGGCSGFQYGFKFDHEKLDEDTEVEQDGVTVVVDSLSIQYLEGAHLDFEESLLGSNFSVKNPNATTQCSCGASFSV